MKGIGLRMEGHVVGIFAEMGDANENVSLRGVHAHTLQIFTFFIRGVGRDWLARLQVNTGQVNLVEHDHLNNKHAAVFDSRLSCMSMQRSKPNFSSREVCPICYRKK